MLRRVFTVFTVALSVACGGATELNSGDGNGSGGTGGHGGASSVATSGRVTSVTSATSACTASATASNTTGSNCEGFECGGTPCPDGRLETRPGECCPVCVCDVACAPVSCPNGRLETPRGYCCPRCIETLCEGVTCDAPIDCGDGRTFTRPDGACCSGCIPDAPNTVGCVAIECPQENRCAAGFIRGDLLGGCCYECLPDPLYCDSDDDCVLANRPRSCCGCPEVISTRALDDDACWYSVLDPRPVPEECFLDAACDAACAPCPDPGVTACVNNRCMSVLK